MNREVTGLAMWEQFKKQFPKGAQVRLNSGGESPPMAVKDHVEEGKEKERMLCQWFSGKKLESGHFSPETLVLAKAHAEAPVGPLEQSALDAAGFAQLSDEQLKRLRLLVEELRGTGLKITIDWPQSSVDSDSQILRA